MTEQNHNPADSDLNQGETSGDVGANENLTVEQLQKSVNKLEKNKNAILEEKRLLSTAKAETEQKFLDYAAEVTMKGLLSELRPMDGAEELLRFKLKDRVKAEFDDEGSLITGFTDDKGESIELDDLIKQVKSIPENAMLIKGVNSTGANAHKGASAGFTSRESGNVNKQPSQFGLGK